MARPTRTTKKKPSASLVSQSSRSDPYHPATDSDTEDDSDGIPADEIEFSTKKSRGKTVRISFSNGFTRLGDHSDATSCLQIVESAKKKLVHGAPDDTLINLGQEFSMFFAVKFGRMKDYNLFDHGMISCTLLAYQLNLSLPNFLQCRSWVVETRQRGDVAKNGEYQVSYRKFEEVLEEMAPHLDDNDDHNNDDEEEEDDDKKKDDEEDEDKKKEASSNAYKNFCTSIEKLVRKINSCVLYNNWNSNLAAVSEEHRRALAGVDDGSNSNLVKREDQHPTKMLDIQDTMKIVRDMVNHSEYIHLCYLIVDLIFAPGLFALTDQGFFNLTFADLKFYIGAIFGSCGSRTKIHKALANIMRLFGTPERIISNMDLYFQCIMNPIETVNLVDGEPGNDFITSECKDFHRKYVPLMTRSEASEMLEEEERMNNSVDILIQGILEKSLVKIKEVIERDASQKNEPLTQNQCIKQTSEKRRQVRKMRSTIDYKKQRTEYISGVAARWFHMPIVRKRVVDKYRHDLNRQRMKENTLTRLIEPVEIKAPPPCIKSKPRPVPLALTVATVPMNKMKRVLEGIGADKDKVALECFENDEEEEDVVEEEEEEEEETNTLPDKKRIRFDANKEESSGDKAALVSRITQEESLLETASARNILSNEFLRSLDISDHSLKIVNPDDLLQFKPRLEIWESSRSAFEDQVSFFRLLNAPIEFYAIISLGLNRHRWTWLEELKEEFDQNMLRQIGPRQSSYFEYEEGTLGRRLSKIILRPESAHFDKYFGDLGLSCSLALLLNHARLHGDSDKARDDFGQIQCRFWLSCGSLSYEKGADGKSHPKRITNEKTFEKEKDPVVRENLKRSLANVIDAMQECLDGEHTRRNLALPNYDPNRDAKYASALRQVLSASTSRFEIATVIAKCLGILSQKLLEDFKKQGVNSTKWHLDSLNDDDTEGFGFVSTLGWFLVDTKSNTLWNLKVTATARSSVASDIRSNPTLRDDALRGTKGNCLRTLARIDSAYLAFYRGYDLVNGSNLRSDEIPTARQWQRLFLDDHCPWRKININQGLKGGDDKILPPLEKECILFPTGVDRMGPWCWAPATVLHRLGQVGIRDDRLVDILFLAGLQSSHTHFHHVGMELAEDKTFIESEFPGQKFADEMIRRYGSISKGKYTRFQNSNCVSAFHYLFEDSDKARKSMKAVRKVFVDIMRRFNELPEDAHFEQVENLFDQGHSCWHGIQIKHFRLTLIVQMAAMVKYGFRESKLLNNIAYPVKDLASYKNLAKQGITDMADFDRMAKIICKWLDMPPSGNVAETILCESFDERDENKVDYIPKGINVYHGDVEGRRYVKYYNTNHSTPMDIKWEVL